MKRWWKRCSPPGKRLAGALDELPLFYGNDDCLALVQDLPRGARAALPLLLNEPASGTRCSTRSASRPSPQRRGLPVPRTLDWDALDSEYGPVLVKPKTQDRLGRLRLLPSALRRRRQGARVRERPRSARAQPLAQQLRDELAVPGIRARRGRPPSGRSTASPTRTAKCSRGSSGARSAPIPPLTGEQRFLELAHDERWSALGRDVAARAAAYAASSRWTSSATRSTGRWLPARDQRALQPLALPRRAQRREPAARRVRLSACRARAAALPRLRARRAAGSRCATTGAPTAERRARRARLRAAGSRSLLARAQGLRPVLVERSAAFPSPLDGRSCAPRFTRRMHRWLSTAS